MHNLNIVNVMKLFLKKWQSPNMQQLVVYLIAIVVFYSLLLIVNHSASA